jgi:CDP-diacylglycerol--glycerol-3-phosphate 3-phosphatidyltransferase
MASIYDLKPAFQNLLRPFARALFRAGVTANQITVLAALLSAAVGACLWFYPLARWPLFLVPAFLFVRMALNAIDGMLAREHGQKSRLGAVLNELGDVMADAALYLPFAARPGFDARLVVVAVILAIVSEMTGVVALQIGATRRYDGPMGKSDRAFAFGFFALLLALGVRSGRWQTLALAIVCVLLAATIVNRARRALCEAVAASSTR